jgi:hypothetical protein
VSLQDAQVLRDVAMVGSNCPEVHLKANVVMEDCGSAAACPAFDYGVAGTPIINIFFVENTGFETVGIADGLTLAPPFSWTSGAYPGGTGTSSPSGIQFCPTSLPPSSLCVLSVTYSGAAPGDDLLTLDLTDAYSPSLVRELRGSSTTRALLTISEDPALFGCTDTSCGNAPAGVFAIQGSSATLNLFATNRGGAPTTALGVGTPLSPPFCWGPGGPDGTFPGGSGTVQVGNAAYDYCTTQALGVGQQCILTVVFSPTVSDTQLAGALDLAYSDAQGSVLPDAHRNILGTTEPVCPPGASCGGPCDLDGGNCAFGITGPTMFCRGSPDAGATWTCYPP